MKKTLYSLFSVLILPFMSACSTSGEKEQHDWLSQVKSVNKLTLAQMSISKMVSIDDIKLEDAKDVKQTVAALTDAMKIGKRRAAYSYSTYLRAYLDLSMLTDDDIEVDEESGVITITLPEIQTEFTGRDPGLTEVHYRVTGLRSAIDSRERAQIKEKMNSALKKEVEGNTDFRDRLIAEAKGKAVAYFTDLLSENGYKAIVNFN